MPHTLTDAAACLSLLLSVHTIAQTQTVPTTPPPPVPTTALPATPTQQTEQPQVIETPSTLGPLSPQIDSPGNPAQWTRQTLTVASCAGAPPKMDGVLDDPCWAAATHVKGFYAFGGSMTIAPNEQTEAWLCVDQTHLYVAFHCLSPHPDHLVDTQTQRGGDLSRNDFVGFDLDSEGAQRTFATFMTNPRGTQFEQLEGGTADNVTWAGDWKAAGHRTKDGWTAEFAIPFALLRYPRGTHRFGILLYRSILGQPALEGWPYVPLVGANNGTEAQYMASLNGIAAPYYAPRPTFLPYTLISAGEGTAMRNGLDVKYPLSPTITGVATLFPDFRTIEQDVTNINFSYTPKLLTDRRPFFAEGAAFLPDTDLFYSRSIGPLDEGLKVAGKDGPTTIGVLGTNQRNGVDRQDTTAVNLRRDFTALSSVGAQFVADDQTGLPNNRVARVSGAYGWKGRSDQYTFSGFHTQSFDGGRKTGGSDSINFGSSEPNNQPYVYAGYSDIGPNFVSDLGYVPEIDRRGGNIGFGENRVFARGRLSILGIGVDADSYQHHSGGFFHDDADLSIYAQTNNGLSLVLVPNVDQREQFHDSTLYTQFNWGGLTLYQRGRLVESFGHQAGQRYQYAEIRQGILISRPFSLLVDTSRLNLGPTQSTQTIVTGTYLLSETRSLGGRIVGRDRDTDLYVSFAQKVRSGTDIFLLFGDPNSPRTRGLITLKLVRPI